MEQSTTNRRAGLGSAPGQTPANKGRKFPAEPLTQTEAEALIAACSPVSRTGIRNRALLTVLYRSGLRIAEALALKVSDIDMERGSVRILYGKGKKARTANLDAGGVAVVARWIDARRAAGIRNGPLFCTLAGGPLNDRYVRNLLHRLALRAGIDKRVHPHGFRHTHAVELMAEGIPVNVISKQLGHSSSAVTARYLDHMSPADVAAAIRRRVWKEPD